MALATIYVQDIDFKLNGGSFKTSIKSCTLPTIGKQLRLKTSINDTYPVYESSKFDIDTDFTVDCWYDSGSLVQEPLISHLKGAEASGTTAVSASSFEFILTTGQHLTGSCIPKQFVWGSIANKPDAVAVQFGFKKLQVIG